MRTGRTSMMRAPEWRSLVRIPDCEPVNEIAASPRCLERHRQQRHRDALAARQQHVELAPRRRRRHRARQRQQLVGGLAHRRDHDDHALAQRHRRGHAIGDAPEPRRIGDARAAIFLHDDRLHASHLYVARLSIIPALFSPNVLPPSRRPAGPARPPARTLRTSAPPRRRPPSITPDRPGQSRSPARTTTTAARAEYDALDRARARARRRAAPRSRRTSSSSSTRISIAATSKRPTTSSSRRRRSGIPRSSPARSRTTALRDAAVRIEQAFKKRGAHEEVLVALVLELTLAPGDAAVRARYDEIAGWLRAGGATESEMRRDRRRPRPRHRRSRDRGAPVAVALRRRRADARSTSSATTPASPAIRSASAAGRARAATTCARILQGGPRPSTAYDLARLYLRISKPDEAVAKLRAHQDAAAGRRADPRAHRALGRQAGDAARRHQRGRPARAGARRRRRRRARVHRRHRGASPQARRAAPVRRRDRHGARSARRRHARVRGGAPAAADATARSGSSWRACGSAASSPSSTTRTSTSSQLEPQLKKVEAFHAAAHKQFPGEPIHPSLAGALFEVGRGYYNAGRVRQGDGVPRALARPSSRRRRRSSRWARSA